MDAGTIRTRLHEYIDQADQKHLEAIYTLLEKDLEPKYQYDSATLEMLYKRRNDHLQEQTLSYSASEAIEWVKKQGKKIMSYDLVIKEEARQDMLDAYLYYEQEREGLGNLFLSMVEERFSAISEHPEYYSYIDDKKILRDVSLHIFPFVIVFEKDNSNVIVYAICSTHRSPRSHE